tara:strand:+ start:128 stop:409 length:282 start_codon:yes stop_codon:yes gene_type:complete
MGDSEQKWIPFWWASNLFTKRVKSPADWEEVWSWFYDSYTKVNLGKAKESPSGHGRDEAKIPSFGFLIEHAGKLTLKDWADANQMVLKGVNDT